MATIHPLACVSPLAKLGEHVEVGPYAFIDANVEIGDYTKVHPHASIFPYVKIGEHCEVFPGAVVGAIPQDLKFDGEITYVEIGNYVTIRECATINRGTKASGKGVTKIGKHAMIGGGSKINKDIPPYSLCGREPVCYAGVNLVGLRRRGFDSDTIRNIKDIYDMLYFQGYNISDACARIQLGFPDSPEKDEILTFIRNSKRGIVRGSDSREKVIIE